MISGNSPSSWAFSLTGLSGISETPGEFCYQKHHYEKEPDVRYFRHSSHSRKQLPEFALSATCGIGSRTASIVRIIRLVCVCCAVMHAASGVADGPFVPGFERFGRHQEIDSGIAGRLLLTELSCTACHSTDRRWLEPKGGPRLDAAGVRLRRDWIVGFLKDPQSVKPGTTMPNVLDAVPETERDDVARALTAFVGTLQEPYSEIQGNGANPVPHEFWKHGKISSGRQLFHQVGCVACHAPDPDYETVETKPSQLDIAFEQLDQEELKELGLASAARRVDSVPLGTLDRKYSHRSLTHFLLDPHQTRPAGRMPDFGLGALDAADIAAWLLRKASDSTQFTTDRSEDRDTTETARVVEAGRRYFVELGCANCHSAGGLKAQMRGKPLVDLDPKSSRSCIVADASGPVSYKLSDVQRDVLSELLQVPAKERGSQEVTDLQQLQHRLLQLNCLACHERDRLGGVGRYRKPYFETVGHVDIGDEGRLPPPLSGVGKKLTSKAVKTALDGKLRLRPHMRIRMPVFPAAQVKPLPELFSRTDSRVAPAAEKEVFGAKSNLAEAGRGLLDVGCIQCHALKGNAMPGVVGVDLDGIAARVHPGWFREFLLNPGSLKPQTRMPTFFPNGQSQNRQVLNGDTEKQIAAMWFYLKDLNRQPLPPKIEKARSQSYELIPKGRPIVLRTFMEAAGTHAVAVGFRQQVHFAFDAEQVRPALAWRGRFLDAQGTWFVRFAPPAEPLGQQSVHLPPGVPFAELASPDAPWPADSGTQPLYRFQGYRLDASGVPTFLYQYGRFDIEDRIEPGQGQSLLRQLTVRDRRSSAEPMTLWLRAHAGDELKHDGLLSCTSGSGLTVIVGKDAGHAGEFRRQENAGMEWLIPVNVHQRRTIEVQYKW